MATNETIIFDLKVDMTLALKQQQDLKKSIEDIRAAQKSNADKTSAEYINNEAQLKNLNNQLLNNSKILQANAQNATDETGAYRKLSDAYLFQAAKAKDLAVAYGANSKEAKDAALAAKDMSDKLKGIDLSVGQAQRSVGDYSITLKTLPGVFGDMQKSGQSVLVSLRTKFDSVKDATMSVSNAMMTQRETMAAAMHAAEKAAIAEQALSTAEKAGAGTAILTAEAEAARAVATETATVATEASTTAMKVFKFALASTGIGLLVVALGAVVAYFTKTNEGSKEFAKITAGINAVIQSGIKILGSYGKLLFAIATFDLKKIKEGWSEIGTNIKNATTEIGANYKAGVENVAASKAMAKQEREWSGERLKLLKTYEEARFNSGKKSKLDDEGKIESAKKALKINEDIYKKDLEIAKAKAIMIENEQKLNSKKDYAAIQDAKNKVQEIINAHAMQQLTVDALLGKAEGRLEDAGKKEVSIKKKTIKTKEELDKEAADNAKKIEDERLKALRIASDDAIELLKYEVQMRKEKQDESIAGLKMTNKEYRDFQVNNIIKNAADEADILNAKLRNEQITIDEFEKQKALIRQKVKTDTAIENAAFNNAEKERKITAAATDLQNEMDIATAKGQSLLNLQLQQNEASRVAELADAEKTGADKQLINDKYTQLAIDLTRKEKDAKLSLYSGFAGNLATIFGKNTVVGKAAASAQVAIDTYKGAMAAYTSMAGIPVIGVGLGIAAAAAVGVTGAKAIKDIWSVPVPGGGGGGGSAPSISTPSSGGGSIPQASVAGGIVARSTSPSQAAQVAQGVGSALQANPMQPVLVTNDLTIAQNQKVQLQNDNSL